MAPAHFVFLDAFPLTPNGKVDRRALPVPEKALSRQEFVSPKHASESKLAAIWIELLGVSPLSVTDNFFDLGGHSLLAAKLLVGIERSFGKRLSMGTLFQAPTIRQLAVILEGQVLSTPLVIPVQPVGSLPPFFCIGAGPLFRPLALRLGNDRPFLSLIPAHLPELKRLSAPYELGSIAACLVDSILDYQKEGPFYLGGWSASGVVAYEIARQLIDKGHEVALLVMFDTVNPAFQKSVPRGVWLGSRAKKIKFQVAELLGLKLKNAPAYVAEKVKEFGRKIEAAAWQIQYKIRMRRNGDPLENPEQILHLAISSYRPPAYTRRLVFFKCADRPPGDAWDMSRGWPHLVTGGFEVYEIPGDHRSMFLEPHVETLAVHMMNCFRRRDSEPVAGGETTQVHY
jgi:thioesterase domain-containing protein/acyl carrier protein